MNALPTPADPAQHFDSAWQAYERAKADFLATHPDASPQDIEQALKRLAEQEGL
jgi:hypothetical protein